MVSCYLAPTVSMERNFNPLVIVYSPILMLTVKVLFFGKRIVSLIPEYYGDKSRSGTDIFFHALSRTS